MQGLRLARAPLAPCMPKRNAIRMAPSTPKAATSEYGYVLATVATSAAIVQWMALSVAKARRACGLQYPAMYATGTDDASQVFNCTQRGHQNTLENLPQLLILVALLGTRYPITAAVLGMVWNIGRIIYFTLYSTGDPKKRNVGFAICFFTFVGLIGATLVTGVREVLPLIRG